MAVPFVGHVETSLGLGQESTNGTPVSRTHWFRVESFTGGASTQFATRSTLAASTGSFNSIARFKVRTNIAFTVKLLVGFEGFGIIWKNVFGKAPESPSGSGPYTHTQKLGIVKNFSLTAEIILGDGSAEVFAGCVATKAVVEVSEGGEMSVTLDFVGMSTGGRTSAGTPTYTANEYFVNSGMVSSALTWNSYAWAWKSLRWTIDRGVSTRRLGGSYDAALAVPGRLKVSLDIEAEYDSDTPQTGQMAGTQADCSVTFTDDTRTWTLELHNAFLDEAATDLAEGPLPMKARLVGLSDGTDEGLELVVVNSQSTTLAA